MRYTNNNNISTFSSVWLLDSDYNNGQHLYPGRELISATTLMKPTRQTVLKQRVSSETLSTDISDLVASRAGSAIHDSIERTWRSSKRVYILQLLGYTKEEAESFLIDPEPEDIKEHNVPVYLERRFFKELNGYIISGKVDAIFDGQLIDVKNTSTYSYTSSNKDDDYVLQGSIYRWLAPELITSDTIHIDYKFTDWVRSKVGTEGYPVSKSFSVHYNLMSLEETEEYIINKINEIEHNKTLQQDSMIRCSKKDLWQGDPVHKYFSDPSKANIPGSRATKNFKVLQEAQEHLSVKGKGIIKTVESEPKACLYCPVYDFCEQRKEYGL